MDSLNSRQELLLKALVESFISDGQPVGSTKLSQTQNIAISSATIRGVFGDLEDLGYIYSPHKSAGRVPTELGYRMFVDKMVKVQPVDINLIKKLKINLTKDHERKSIIQKTNEVLSSITELTGIISLPTQKNAELKQIDFLKLSDDKILAILINKNNDVENKIINLDRVYSSSELQEASNYLNTIISGQSVLHIRKILLNELEEMRKDMNSIMSSAITFGKKLFLDTDGLNNESDLLVSGQTRLMNCKELSDIDTLKTLFEAFSEKNNILHLLDKSISSDGVKIFIGAESGYNVLDDCSIVSAPYKFDNDVVGVLGVIGPKRMAYDRVIPIVDITAKLLSEALKSSD
ncbi:heat-inducible transcriptional repressor HrcA [Gammaproteobacteria bacterium]|nr:heat-inducible transcriptional repressor HrcA [Gammaproteobacteria bacterium]